MTEEQLIIYSKCLKYGPSFLIHCGATYEIAINAFQQLAAAEKVKFAAAMKRQEEARKADEAAKTLMRAKLVADAQRANAIKEAKKLASDSAKIYADLIKEDQDAKEAEKANFLEEGRKFKEKFKKTQLLKRERSSITAAENSLRMSLNVNKKKPKDTSSIISKMAKKATETGVSIREYSPRRDWRNEKINPEMVISISDTEDEAVVAPKKKIRRRSRLSDTSDEDRTQPQPQPKVDFKFPKIPPIRIKKGEIVRAVDSITKEKTCDLDAYSSSSSDE